MEPLKLFAMTMGRWMRQNPALPFYARNADDARARIISAALVAAAVADDCVETLVSEAARALIDKRSTAFSYFTEGYDDGHGLWKHWRSCVGVGSGRKSANDCGGRIVAVAEFFCEEIMKLAATKPYAVRESALSEQLIDGHTHTFCEVFAIAKTSTFAAWLSVVKSCGVRTGLRTGLRPAPVAQPYDAQEIEKLIHSAIEAEWELGDDDDAD